MSAPDTGPAPELETCAHDLRHAAEDARNLLTYNDPEVLRKRPSKTSWSALECMLHLNLSNQAMLPGIRLAVETAPETRSDARAYKMDMTGRFLAWSLLLLSSSKQPRLPSRLKEQIRRRNLFSRSFSVFTIN